MVPGREGGVGGYLGSGAGIRTQNLTVNSRLLCR